MCQKHRIRKVCSVKTCLTGGCGGDMIRRCMDLAGQQKCGELLRILACHRRELLALVHLSEKQIDCLDYLVYQIEKQENKTDL